jgi:hypothetical protein
MAKKAASPAGHQPVACTVQIQGINDFALPLIEGYQEYVLRNPLGQIALQLLAQSPATTELLTEATNTDSAAAPLIRTAVVPHSPLLSQTYAVLVSAEARNQCWVPTRS